MSTWKECVDLLLRAEMGLADGHSNKSIEESALGSTDAEV